MSKLKLFEEVSKEAKVEFKECKVMLKDIKEKIQRKLKLKVESPKSLDKEKSKNSKFSCNICHKELSTFSSFNGHMKLKHPNEMKNLLSCQFCNKKFIYKHSLQRHIKINHFDGKIHFLECDFCGKIYNDKHHFHDHVQNHIPKEKCRLCNSEYKKWDMKRHMRQVHTKGEFNCEICNKVFETNIRLRRHEKYHNKNLKCEICNKLFLYKFELKNHRLKIHENSEAVSCEICHRTFNSKLNLKRHKQIHQKFLRKSFKCEKCDFVTLNQSYIKTHMIVHQKMDEKFAAIDNKVKCDICPAFCRNKYALNVHKKFVHPKAAFQCDLCGKYIKNEKYLVKHIQAHSLKPLSHSEYDN